MTRTDRAIIRGMFSLIMIGIRLALATDRRLMSHEQDWWDEYIEFKDQVDKWAEIDQ